MTTTLENIIISTTSSLNDSIVFKILSGVFLLADVDLTVTPLLLKQNQLNDSEKAMVDELKQNITYQVNLFIQVYLFLFSLF